MINLIAIQPPVAFAAPRGTGVIGLIGRLAQQAKQWITAEPVDITDVLARAKRYESSQPSFAADLRAAAQAAATGR